MRPYAINDAKKIWDDYYRVETAGVGQHDLVDFGLVYVGHGSGFVFRVRGCWGFG